MAEKKKKSVVVAPVSAEDKKKALATALSQIEKDFGEGAIMKLGANPHMAVQAIHTGSLSLDLALGIGGVPRSDGRIVVCTSRSKGEVHIWDFANPRKPKLLREYKLSGRPDLAAIHNGLAIIPAGHQGLLMERGK